MGTQASHEPPSFAQGSNFAGYVITRELGRGGMGAVYLAREQGLERTVAIKVLLASVADDAAFAERFVQEARIVANLEHPNIISLYAYGITEQVPWMALRFVDGGDLAERLKSPSAQRKLGLDSEHWADVDAC